MTRALCLLLAWILTLLAIAAGGLTIYTSGAGLLQADALRGLPIDRRLLSLIAGIVVFALWFFPAMWFFIEARKIHLLEQIRDEALRANAR